MTMNENIKFQMTKLIKAKREKVFAAWADASILKNWFGPETLNVPDAQLDFKEGGYFKIDFEGEMRDQQTKGYATGTYKKIIPNELLIFTFKGSWKGGSPESLVTVMFKDVKEGTELTLTQEQIVNKEALEGFKHGWGSSLEKLAQLFIQEFAKI
jgi:uncharacterized protein YndB with AHSA1/START domain